MMKVSSPSWSTASGLLLYARQAEESQGKVQKKAGFSMRSMVGSLRGMFADLL